MTFASSLSNFASSAAFPSGVPSAQMIFPAALAGGGINLATLALLAGERPSAAAFFTSTGFFFAFMIPGRDA